MSNAMMLPNANNYPWVDWRKPTAMVTTFVLGDKTSHLVHLSDDERSKSIHLHRARDVDSLLEFFPEVQLLRWSHVVY